MEFVVVFNKPISIFLIEPLDGQNVNAIKV